MSIPTSPEGINRERLEANINELALMWMAGAPLPNGVVIEKKDRGASSAWFNPISDYIRAAVKFLELKDKYEVTIVNGRAHVLPKKGASHA